jgi:hypothetical protein
MPTRGIFSSQIDETVWPNGATAHWFKDKQQMTNNGPRARNPQTFSDWVTYHMAIFGAAAIGATKKGNSSASPRTFAFNLNDKHSVSTNVFSPSPVIQALLHSAMAFQLADPTPFIPHGYARQDVHR